MHVPDGMLPLPVTLAGYAASAALVGFCIYKIKQRGDPRDDIPKAALLAAAFFSASLIQIPIPPASVHLVLGGLLGAVLGLKFTGLSLSIYAQLGLIMLVGIASKNAILIVEFARDSRESGGKSNAWHKRDGLLDPLSRGIVLHCCIRDIAACCKQEGGY